MAIDEAIAHAQETADTRPDLCDKCRDEHRQLAEWLTELKQLRDSFENQRSINYELVDENQELVHENKELKRLLRLAVDDLAWSNCNAGDNGECPDCPYYSGKPGRCLKEWKHAEEALEALKPIGDDK